MRMGGQRPANLLGDGERAVYPETVSPGRVTESSWSLSWPVHFKYVHLTNITTGQDKLQEDPVTNKLKSHSVFLTHARPPHPSSRRLSLFWFVSTEYLRSFW